MGAGALESGPNGLQERVRHAGPAVVPPHGGDNDGEAMVPGLTENDIRHTPEARRIREAAAAKFMHVPGSFIHGSLSLSMEPRPNPE